jgi:lysophospholipase L1-like esterase
MISRSSLHALTGGLLAAALAASAHAAAPRTASPAAPAWTPAWGAAPFGLLAKDIPKHTRIYENQTVRQVVRSGLAGNRIRIRLSNEVGKEAVQVGAIRVALSDVDGRTRPGTERRVTFGGAGAFSIPAGAPMLSDPVDLPVGRFNEVAVSVFDPERTEAAAHRLPVILSPPGDHTAEAEIAGGTTTYGAALASQIEVAGGSAKRVIVAFGDSITEGAGSTAKAHKSWPDQFAALLAADPKRRDWVVLNMGISGNRVLHDGAGPNGLARFQRDVLDTPGVTDVVLLEGINDIGWGHRPGEIATAADLIAAYKQMVLRAHARGVRIYAGTLLPFEGAVYYSPEGEADRQTVNRWIRTSGAFDGVVDFEAVTRDPAKPLQIRKDLQIGDNLHPGDAGYTVMAKAVDAQLFGGARR